MKYYSNDRGLALLGNNKVQHFTGYVHHIPGGKISNYCYFLTGSNTDFYLFLNRIVDYREREGGREVCACVCRCVCVCVLDEEGSWVFASRALVAVSKQPCI